VSRRAVIAGAGIGGLATALALSQAQFDVTIYERADALEEFGAGLQLTPNSTRVLLNLGVLGHVRTVAMSPHAVCALRGSDDSSLMHMPVSDAESRWGAPYLTLHRADLQRVLLEAVGLLRNVKLLYGSTVAGVVADGGRIIIEVKRGTATIHDSAELLIGADGLHSSVRESLDLGQQDRPEFAGRVAFRGIVESFRVDPRWIGPEVCLRLGPNAHLVHYPLRSASILNLVAVIESSWRVRGDDHPWDGEADQPALDRAFASWSQSSRKLLAAVADWRAWPLYCRPPMRSFAFGRVALVGDAAHPMVPFLAQGAAQAIEDAGALKRIFSWLENIPDALVAYSSDRVARATRVQLEAQKQGRIYHLSGPLASTRDVVMRLLGPERICARYDWLYGR
jgi:salicylate hydroxylase